MDKLNISNILNRENIKKDIEVFLKNFYNDKKNISITRGIYLHGETGIGKTYFIKELLKYLNYDIIYYDASDSRNKNIIQKCKLNRLPLKDYYKDLQRVPILNNCPYDIPYNIMTPPCPLQPYKKNFVSIKKSSLTSVKSSKSLKSKSKSFPKSKYSSKIKSI